jgi:hypothetical protein
MRAWPRRSPSRDARAFRLLRLLRLLRAPRSSSAAPRAPPPPRPALLLLLLLLFLRAPRSSSAAPRAPRFSSAAPPRSSSAASAAPRAPRSSSALLRWRTGGRSPQRPSAVRWTTSGNGGGQIEGGIFFRRRWSVERRIPNVRAAALMFPQWNVNTR